MKNKHLGTILIFFLMTFSISSFAVKPIIILDTDMGFDDWLAVLYVLKSPDIKLLAMTIDCQGESRCPAGATNAARLTNLAEHKVPIAYGRSDPSSSYLFPPVIRDYASAMSVPGFKKLKTDRDVLLASAAQLIEKQLVQAALRHKKISIISIGTAINIADAYKLAENNHQVKLFKAGLGMIYKGGGAFGKIINGKVTNQSIHGNIAIKDIYKSNNKTAEWNIYAAAPAMQTLLNANLPVTFIPLNATDHVPMTTPVYQYLKAHQKNHPFARFTANAMHALYKMQDGWMQCEFWDTSVTLAALHQAIVTKKIAGVPVVVSLQKNKCYGSTLVSRKSADRVVVDYSINASAFYQLLYQVII